jgi:hypothetical protein
MPEFRVIEGGLAKRQRSRRVLPSIPELRSRLWRASRRQLRIREFDVTVFREPFRSIDDREHDEAVDHRHTLCTFARDGAEVGCMFFAEFQPPTLCLNVQFWEALDGYSMDDAFLAETLCAAWDWIGPDVSDYGNIVELRVVGAWAGISNTTELLNATIDRLFPKHSIIVAQAFPLNPRDWRQRDQVYPRKRDERLRDALMRVCARRLGFAALPSAEAAEDGWMWRPRADLAGLSSRQQRSPSPRQRGSAKARSLPRNRAVQSRPLFAENRR